MGAIIAVGLEIAAQVAKWTATRLFLTALLMVGLPFVLKGVINWAFDEILSFTLSLLTAAIPQLDAASLSITGVSAWLFQTANLGTAISIVLSAVAIRFALNFIPFIK